MNANKRNYDWSKLWAEHHKKEIIFYILKKFVSNPISKVLIKYTSLTANQASVLALSMIFIAFPFFASKSSQLQMVGFFFIFVYYIFDLVDGDIARIKNQVTMLGKWLDNITGHISLPFIVFPIMLSIDTTLGYRIGAWSMISFTFMYTFNSSFKQDTLEIQDSTSLANLFKTGFLGYFWGYAWVFLVLFIAILINKPILFLLAVALGNLGTIFLLFLQYKQIRKIDKQGK